MWKGGRPGTKALLYTVISETNEAVKFGRRPAATQLANLFYKQHTISSLIHVEMTIAYYTSVLSLHLLGVS